MAGTMIQRRCSCSPILEGDTLNVALQVPLSRRLSYTGLVDALTAHYWSPGRLADYRRQFERTTRTLGEDPAIFATALETLAVKAFGDIGQTARLRLIRDRFIAGHSSCELWRHLESVPPETPIRDVVDRCRVWESHADPAARRVSKPSPDAIYPAYVVEDSANISETTRVAAVTRLRSGPDQLIRGLASMVTDGRGYPGSDTGITCGREVVTASGGGNTKSSASGCKSSGVGGFGNDAMVVSFRTTAREAATEAASSTATCPTALERSDVFLMWEVGSCCDSVPKLGRGVSIYAAGMVCREDSGGGGGEGLL